MSKHLQQHLRLAVETAHAAGSILRGGVGLRHVNMQDAKDVKLKADVESEKLIRSRLLPTGLPVIGEEQGGDPALPDSDRTYWVVDPLDGTYNYLRGFPLCCVSIGLMRGREPLLGVIHDFNSGETWSALADGPLLFQGQPLKPVWPEEITHASLLTGFPAGRDYSTGALNAFVSEIQRFQKIRMIGSAALALAYVACGRGDAYCEESIRLWDIAGGLALAKAAGATVRIGPSTTPEKPFSCNVWVAGRAEWLP